MNDSIVNFKNYLKAQEKSKATISAYTSDVKKFLLEMGEELTSYKVKKTLENIYNSNKYSISSLIRKKYSWNCFCDFIKTTDWKITKRIKRCYTYQEDVIEIADVQNMLLFLRNKLLQLKSIPEKIKTYKQMIFLSLGLNEGLRASEYHNLKFHDALEKREVEIRDSKNGVSRKVPVTAPTRLIIENFRNFLIENKKPYNQYIFSNNSGKTLTTRTFQRWIKEIAELSKVPLELAKTHGLRHRFARNIYEQFNDIVLISSILGHQSLETTKIYTRPCKKSIEKIMNEASKIRIEMLEIA